MKEPQILTQASEVWRISVMTNPTGIIFYQGPSKIDGQPIIGILTLRSANTKTGDMAQAWILRADQNPVAALHSGADRSICGACPLRGQAGKDRACYVTVAHAPLTVWRTWQAGGYPDLSGASHPTLRAIFDTVTPRVTAIRFGAYGEPTAIPIRVWRSLLQAAGLRPGQHAAYTHAWRTCRPEWRRLAMASVESLQDAHDAARRGWRTFRVQPSADGAALGEIVCPASAESGHRTSCRDCRLCSGTDGRGRGSVVITAHGSGAAFVPR